MSSIEKTLHKMKVNFKDWRIEDLERIARHYGIMVRKSGGSHVIFDHTKWIELLSVPSRRPIKPIYIKKFMSLIEILENNNE